MRLIKMFGFAAIAAVAAMAFVGGSSAMANGPTALCLKNETPCLLKTELEALKALQIAMEEPVTVPQPETENMVLNLHMELTAKTIGKLVGKNPNITVLCLGVLAKAHVLDLGQPQIIHVEELNFANCGTTKAHNNCTITNLKPFLMELLRTAAGVGTATATGGETFVECTLLGFIEIECEYAGKGLQFEVQSAGGANGHGMLNAKGTPLPLTSGGSLCSETSEITEGLLEPLVDTWIST